MKCSRILIFVSDPSDKCDMCEGIEAQGAAYHELEGHIILSMVRWCVYKKSLCDPYCCLMLNECLALVKTWNQQVQVDSHWRTLNLSIVLWFLSWVLVVVCPMCHKCRAPKPKISATYQASITPWSRFVPKLPCPNAQNGYSSGGFISDVEVWAKWRTALDGIVMDSDGMLLNPYPFWVHHESICLMEKIENTRLKRTIIGFQYIYIYVYIVSLCIPYIQRATQVVDQGRLVTKNG